MNVNIDKYIGVLDAAWMLMCSESTIRLMCDQGKLRHIRIGGRRRIYKPDIERMKRTRQGIFGRALEEVAK